MLPLPRGAVWQLLFLFCAALYINGVRADGRVVCYYTNWSVYRPGTAKFNPQNINPYLCTHLIYAFGGFTKDNQMKPFDKYQDIEQGGYAKFTGLKTYNKQLKTMIAIGGWNEASSRFSPLVANAERRQKFIKNILKFLRQNHFDGIDLDWEYPAHREGGKARDRDNYAQFVQELRAEFERESEKTGRPRLLLTMAVPAGIEYIEKGYDIPKLNKYLDWFNLLTYDFHSSHEPSVNHHAPLYSLEEESEYNYDAELNIDYSIKFYLNAGADRDKLVLGIPTYGRSYTLINEESTEIGAPAEAPGEQGDATREKGYLAYYEICQNIKEDPEWTVVQPNPNAMGPYAYRRNQWVGYDDEAIVRKKAQYVVENGLGGIMFWAIDNDDFRGICTGKQYPLIEAAKEAMLDALGFGINEVSKPSAPQKPSRSRSRENSVSTRNRITTTEHKLTYAERKGSTKRVQIAQQSSTRSKQQTSTTEAPIKLTEVEGSSLYIGGRTTTPPPPTTPDPGTDFKCEEEGFFQHPRDCKKYYWCLDSGPSGLGIVAHQFTCPSGLYFNPAADSCDFARNVPCKTKKSTTAAPITTPATTTTTTPRPNRLTAATSRPTAFFRTTPRTTTTTTTEASEEEDVEYEEEENSSPSPYAKRKGTDKDAEEDPQVIKELIELIRKVGGIEELEKHLLRKEDGTISIKENSSSSSSSSLTATTPSTISKSLYEKVLSKPNALNSFRNRFTSTSSFRTIKTQTKTQDNAAAAEVEIEESHEADNKSSGATTGFSKYSSVLRGNSRQGPQNEGLSKLSEFDGFLKEKKQYITINRNRGTKKTSDVEEDGEEVEEEVIKTKSDSLTQEEEEEYDVKTTRKAFSSVTPSYSTIRRTRPSTTTEANNDEAEDAEEKEVTERKSYSTLNRSRSRATTTTETPDVVEVTAGSSRYKYLERTRPTRPTTESANKIAEEEEDADVEDDDEAKTKENTVHFKAVNIENTRETQQQQQQEITTNTQRTYASIGRRTTTSTPDTETTTAGAAKTSTATTTTTTAAPTTTTTPSTTETPITTPLTIIETTTPDSILLTTNIPITTTTNPTTQSTTTTTITTTTTKTTTLPNEGEDVLGTSNTTPQTNEINSIISETLDSSLHLNSLLTESSTSTSTTPIPTPTTESGLDTNEQEIDSHSTTTEANISSTTATVLNGNGNDKLTKTADAEDQEEVNLVSKQRNKTLYNTRTRTTTTTTKTLPTTTNSDIETTTTSPTNAKKTLGVRRQQQQQQQQILLNRSSQTKTITTDTPNPTTESVNNDFLGTVSSPRPFGFPKRRARPSINAAGTTTTSAIPNTTDEEVVKSTEESLITKQKASTKLNAAANSQTKVSSHNTILSETTTNTTTTTTANVHDAQTSSQQELLLTQQDESEVTGTEHLNSKDTKVESLNQHVVVAINGSEGINDSLRHVNNVVLNLNSNNSNSNSNINSNSNNSAQTLIKTHTLVQEVDHDDDNDDNKKLIVTEVTTEERVRQKVSPDHVTAVNVLETNDKIERLSNKNEKHDELFKETGKYRGKSLETEENYDYNQVDDGEDEGRAFKPYTTINRRRQQTQSSTGTEIDGNVVNNFRVTEVVKSGIEHELENENKNVGSSVNNKFKYSTITRGQSSKTETVKENEHGSEISGLNIKTKYSSITRGQTSKSETEQGHEQDNESSGLNVKTKYSSATRGQTSKTETDQENEHESESSGLNIKSKYSSINRGQISKTETDQENAHESESSGLKVESKYSSTTRGQTSKTETEQGNDNKSSGLNIKTKYSSTTRGQTSKTETEQENEHENESSGLNIKTKYSSATRGQTSKIQTEQENAHESESSGLSVKSKYSSINRGQTSKTETEQENEHENESSGLNIKTKYSSTTRGQTSKTETDQENAHESESSGLSVKSKYSSINRGQISKTETLQENNHENENATRNIKYSKYPSVNRGQTLYKGTEENESETSSLTNSLVNRGETVYKGTDQNESENSSLNNKFEYSSVTRGQSSKTGTEQENEHESESSGLNVKSKYSSVNRGQTSKSEAEHGNEHDNESSSLNNKFKYSSVTRGQTSKTGTEQENEHESESSGLNVKSKYSSITRGQTSKSEAEHRNEHDNESSSLNNKFKYSSVTRGQTSKTGTEQENEHEIESSGLNLESKYSSVNRGQTLYKGTEQNESANSSLNNKFEHSSVTRGQSSKTGAEQENEHESKNSGLKYSSVNRGQTLYKGTEENESDNSGLNIKSKYSSITRGQTSKSETEHGNEHDNESSSLNNKFKYSSVTKGQTSKTGTVQENEHESESSGLNVESKYSSVNRGQTLYKGTEGNESENSSLNNKFEYSSVTRGQTSKTDTEQKNEHENENSGLNVESKYSSVNRGQTLYKGTDKNESENSSVNNKFEHSSVTRGQSSKTGTEQENEHESENSGLKYSSVNRGQTLYKGTEETESENSGLNIKTKYSSITRGQSSKTGTEQGNEHENESSGLNIKTKYSSITRGNTDGTTQSKFQYTTASQEQNSEENNTANIHSDTTETNGEKKSYTTITRNRGTSTSTENIPYKAIVRDNGGVQLTEDQLSGFIKSAGEEISRKTYQAISRGGQVLQSENTEINEKDHYHINALNTLGRTDIESNRKNANKEDATIEKSVAIEDNATTEKLSTTTTTTTTTEGPTTEQPTTASVLEKTSSTEEAIETTTVPTTTKTTTTTLEPTTRKSFFKSRVTTATSNADSETEVEKSVRKGTFNANSQVKQEEETTTLTGRRRTVYKRPTQSNSQNTNEAKEKTETQTNFRRRTILRKKPTVTVQTETEVDETKQKFDRGSLISQESESSQDGIETSTLKNLPRATYRPKEKGDLSSLLALDLAKKSGNKATLTFGNGKRRRPGQSGLQVSETEDDGETNVHTAGSASDELVSNGESITTATRKRIFGSQGVKLNTEIKGETASQIAGNRSKITFGSAGKISTETSNANNLAASGQQSTTQLVNGRRRVIVRKRIQSGQALRSQNANNVESTVVSNSNINNSESLVNQNGKPQIGLSNGRFSSSTLKSKSNSESESVGTESESVGTETEDSKAVIEGEIKNDEASEVNVKDSKVTGTEKKFSYNSLNRKNSYANRRVVGSQTTEDSENTESIVRTRNKERNSANSVRSQSQDSSRKSAYVNRRGSLNKNNHETTEEVEILEDGSKRIKTTFYETVNTGGQVKIIKRTKIKTIIKQEPEYIDETADITPTTTTRRPLRSRGSAKFHADDLSSLLALDFASKSNRHEQNEKSLTKHRRKLIRKPDIIKEEEHVEEIIEDLPTRPTRLPTTTEASQIISNRIRPSRPTTTEANLTESDSVIKVEEKNVLSTTKRKFGLRRPTNVATKTTIQSSVANETVDKDDTTSTITRRKFTFKRPINTVKTVKTTEQETNVTAQTSTGSAANVQNAEAKDFSVTKRKFQFKRPLGSAQTITNTEQVTKTIITQTEHTNGNAVGGNKFVNRFKSKSVTTNKNEETTTGPLPTVSTVTEPTALETTNPASSTEHTTENLLQNQESLDALKTDLASETQGKTDEISNVLANVVNTLKTATEVETDEKTNILKGKGFTKDITPDLAATVSELAAQAEKVTETEVADAIEMKNEIISGKAFGQDLSLPIYHRRKYYQYYKDSPITYISPATGRSETQQTNINVDQQIHDVFNVSNEHLKENQNNDEVLAVKAVEQAQQINSELSHFLLKTPGSK